jgi:hypothetical protein
MWVRVTVAVIALAVLSGCAREIPRSPLGHTFESPEEAAQAVLDALATRDLPGLERLALTEQEFREHVWPELPASRPERNMPFDYVWGQSIQRSRDFLRQTFATHEGQRFELLAVEFDGETTDYPSFSVSRRTALVVRNGDGEEERLRLFGSLLRQGDRYKIYSYVITD